ncbi:MAG: nucleotidyltransferase family protein [Candidatus Marsarchaeota archaeon]|nr:nucleotidyltransferase family protein [Candidatus Marsarchaeota archaeon]
MDILDAIILCGGFATRLEPITLFVPKPLLPVGGRPIIDQILASISDAGAERIILSTNKKFHDQFKYWADNKAASGFGKNIEIVVEPTMHHGEKFGAIKGIEYTIKSAKLDNDLIVVAGDNYFTFDLARTVAHFRKSRKVTIVLHDIKLLENARRFGVVETDGYRVIGFQEKPQNPKSSLISTGIYLFPRETLTKFDEYLKDGNNTDAPGYFLQWLISNEKIDGVVYRESWYDVGTIDTYKKVFDSHIH